LVIVRCKECEKEYQLKSSDNPGDFQCDCGGNLEYKIGTTSEKPMKRVSEFRKTIDHSSKKKYKSKKNYDEDFKNLRRFIEDINKSINPLALVVGLVVSIIVLIIASFIFGALLVFTGIDSIIFYGIITLVTMTLIGGIVTSFLGSHHLNEGVVNGTILSTLLLIGMGLIVGFVLFVVIGYVSSLLASFSSVGPSTASNATSGSTSNLITSWMNIIYGIVGIILTLIAGAGGGALGVIIKKKLKISL
jgi:hypothetical protein